MSPEELDGVVDALRKGGPCKNCGRHDGHWLGCQPGMAELAMAAAEEQTGGTTFIVMDEKCAKGECQNPKAISKGPRPAKYCETHKTRSK